MASVTPDWQAAAKQAPLSRAELLYMHHERGFALYSMRSPRITRLYLQCRPDEDIREWSDDASGLSCTPASPAKTDGSPPRVKSCTRARPACAVSSWNRCSMDACTSPTMPPRCSTDRRKGNEPGFRRCAPPQCRIRCVLSKKRHKQTPFVLPHVSAAYLESAALFLGG